MLAYCSGAVLNRLLGDIRLVLVGERDRWTPEIRNTSILNYGRIS